MLFWPTRSVLITVVGADSTLAGDSFIARKALAQASLAITGSFVGAFNPRM